MRCRTWSTMRTRLSPPWSEVETADAPAPVNANESAAERYRHSGGDGAAWQSRSHRLCRGANPHARRAGQQLVGR